MLIALVAAAVAEVVMHPARSSSPNAKSGSAAHGAARRIPPYWFVHPGDTFSLIAAKTGRSVAQLEAFNPQVDPDVLTPGERINLWLHPPVFKPRPKPPGPMFWTVRPGQSFGSIAAATHINIVQLEQLNPGLKPASLQPGNRVRLRH